MVGVGHGTADVDRAVDVASDERASFSTCDTGVTDVGGEHGGFDGAAGGAGPIDAPAA